MKKNISLFLALAICIMQLVIPTTVYAAENPSVTATNASGAPEDEIQIDFILSDNPGLTALLVKVEYDSNFLELIDIKDYGFLEEFLQSQQLQIILLTSIGLTAQTITAKTESLLQ